MTVSLEQWRESGAPRDVIVDSVEGAIYRVCLVIEGREHRLLDTDGKTFQRRSVTHVREGLRDLPVATMTLRHSSAYDEMIGQGIRESSNTLLVPLGNEPDPV